MAARKTIANLSLLLASCLLLLLLCELFLRFFYPKYQHVAESHYDYNTMRIWSTIENYRRVTRHPDSGLYRSYYWNNLGMRQHRDFSEVDIEMGVVDDGGQRGSGRSGLGLPTRRPYFETGGNLVSGRPV